MLNRLESLCDFRYHPYPRRCTIGFSQPPVYLLMAMFVKIFAFLLVATICITGCGGSGKTAPDSNSSSAQTLATAKADGVGSQNRRAESRLAEIKSRLSSTKRFTPDIVEALCMLQREAPQHVPTFNLLTSAYVTRQDWNALAELLQAKPESQRTPMEQLQLAKILIKAQRFDDAFELSNAIVENLGKTGQPTNAEASWFAAYAAFHSGDLPRAAEILDADFNTLIAAGHLDAYVVRAMIHFRRGELAEAESLLTTLLQKDASHAPAHDALGRVLVAAGDVERGRRHIQRASEFRDQVTQAEQRSLRLAAMSQSLSGAWNRQEYDACDRLITDMLGDADPQQQVKLYQNLAALRAAQGRQREALEAAEKAKQLSTVEQHK